MKKITVFETEDGKLFKDFTLATKHDVLIKEIARIKRMIRADEKTHDSSFHNGEGFKQLSPKMVAEAKNSFADLIKSEYGDKYYEMYLSYPDGYIVRFLSDSSSELYSLLLVFHCIDSDNRLWGQPYFANNPDKGKQVPL